MNGRESNFANSLVEPLTRREREILALLAQGYSGPEIAEQLTLAVSSVKWHIQHLYGKLGVNNKRQAVTRARELGLLSSQSVAQSPFLPIARPNAEPEPRSEQTLTINSETFPQHNLPLQLSSFIGREKEITELRKLLEISRLVTLTGSGGVGKTRLAIQVANDLAEKFPGGVWMVELASLRDPALVPQAVASALGVQERPDQLIVDSLIFYLKSKNLLLVLDNCEHMISSCAAMADSLLRACQGLRILSTSRQTLGIGGEVVWPVTGLSLPKTHHLLLTEELQSEAIWLFVDRARLIQRHFALTNQNAPAVVQICTRLDGIPLAIELAAARLRVLTIEQIAERLLNSFDILTGGKPTSTPRQQTLQTILDWSYALLSKPEQTLFQRLSVFAGDFGLEATEAICAGYSIGEDEVFDLLSLLVDKSLVETRQMGLEQRYRLLETVRQYAHAKLVQTNELDILHKRHLDWFLQLAAQAEPHLTGQDRLIWLNRLEMEHNDLHAALLWSLQGDDQDALAGARLAGNLWWFWYLRGYWSEGRQWFEIQSRTQTLSLPAEALSSVGWLALFQGDYQAMTAFSKESLILYRKLGDKKNIALLLDNLGMAAEMQGDYGQAKTFFTESLTLRLEIDDETSIASSLLNLGSAVMLLGDYERATALLEECLSLYQEQNDQWNIAWSLLLLGYVDLFQDNFERALPLFMDGLTHFRKLGDRLGTNYGLRGVGGVAVFQGEPIRAVRLLGAAEALGEATSFKLPPGQRDIHESFVAAAHALLDETAFTVAWVEGRAMSLEQAIRYALKEIALG